MFDSKNISDSSVLYSQKIHLEDLYVCFQERGLQAARLSKNGAVLRQSLWQVLFW